MEWNSPTLASRNTSNPTVPKISVLLGIDQVIVEFYSDTCPACKRLEPVWNRISCEAKTEFPELRFAKVSLFCCIEGKIEGNHNLDIVNAYSITHTPTIAFFKKDIHTPTRYDGGKYYEALKYFIRVAFSLDGHG